MWAFPSCGPGPVICAHSLVLSMFLVAPTPVAKVKPPPLLLNLPGYVPDSSGGVFSSGIVFGLILRMCVECTCAHYTHAWVDVHFDGEYACYFMYCQVDNHSCSSSCFMICDFICSVLLYHKKWYSFLFLITVFVFSPCSTVLNLASDNFAAGVCSFRVWSGRETSQTMPAHDIESQLPRCACCVCLLGRGCEVPVCCFWSLPRPERGLISKKNSTFQKKTSKSVFRIQSVPCIKGKVAECVYFFEKNTLI